jgi:anti-sigma regulatory factor (Ser/Thr protein kinase)
VSTVHKFDLPAEGSHELLARFDDELALPAVSVVRSQLVSFLRNWSAALGSQAAENAVLCASELVTNALMHTRSHVITVKAGVWSTCGWPGAVVRGVVGDDDPAGPMVFKEEQDELAENGRGLRLLDALAQWGCTIRDCGKDVWFECPRPDAKLELQTERREYDTQPPDPYSNQRAFWVQAPRLGGRSFRDQGRLPRQPDPLRADENFRR